MGIETRFRCEGCRGRGMCVYCLEDSLAQDGRSYPICRERTMNGSPWAMPCTRLRGHEGPCDSQGNDDDCTDGREVSGMAVDDAGQADSVAEIEEAVEEDAPIGGDGPAGDMTMSCRRLPAMEDRQEKRLKTRQ